MLNVRRQGESDNSWTPVLIATNNTIENIIINVQNCGGTISAGMRFVLSMQEGSQVICRSRGCEVRGGIGRGPI